MADIASNRNDSEQDVTSDALSRDSLVKVASQIIERADELATFSEDDQCLTRTFCCPPMAGVHGRLRTWIDEAGMTARLDPIGNLVGRLEGNEVGGQRVLIIGSHLDTVVDAGRYDGVLGVLLGLGLAELVRENRCKLPFAIDVIGFCEEEGIRYRTPFLGSLAAAGTFDSALLNELDVNEILMRDAISKFGGDPTAIESCSYDPLEVVGYLEPHIEQGPVLDREGLPVGIVTAIAGQTRASVEFCGEAGHAGTVPHDARRDALGAAAEFIGNVEQEACQTDGLFATVGCLEVEPNVANVIPCGARLRLDVRHAEDAIRQATWERLKIVAEQIARRRSVSFSVEWKEEHAAVESSSHLREHLLSAVERSGVQPFLLASGAGHDAAVMGQRFPMAMLFVRSPGGISHHPDESVNKEDVAVALESMWHFVHSLLET